MTTANERRLTDRIKFLETINDTQTATIERLQRETADQQRHIEILKGGK